MSSGKNKKRFKIKRFVSFLFVLAARAKLRRRRRKIDRRIIRQAKAAGAWERLDVLGGCALNLRVWQQYQIRREPGETDAQLRARVIEHIKQTQDQRR